MTRRLDVLILALALAGGHLAAAPSSGPESTAGVDVSASASAPSQSPASWHSAPARAAVAIPSASNTASETDLRLPGSPRITAIASWYRDPRKSGLYAAMPAYRWGMKPWRVEVCTVTRCVVVRVSDHCQCHVGTRKVRGIDLSPDAFARLSPLSRGLVRVTIRRLP